MEVQETVHQKDMLHQEIQVQAMHLPLHLMVAIRELVELIQYLIKEKMS